MRTRLATGSSRAKTTFFGLRQEIDRGIAIQQDEDVIVRNFCGISVDIQNDGVQRNRGHAAMPKNANLPLSFCRFNKPPVTLRTVLELIAAIA